MSQVRVTSTKPITEWLGASSEGICPRTGEFCSRYDYFVSTSVRQIERTSELVRRLSALNYEHVGVAKILDDAIDAAWKIETSETANAVRGADNSLFCAVDKECPFPVIGGTK